MGSHVFRSSEVGSPDFTLHVSPAALSISDVYQPTELTIGTFKKT